MNPLRVGIAGLGTVGAATAALLKRNASLVAMRCDRAVELTAVSARDRNRDRGIDLGGIAWIENPLDLAKSDQVDVVVETIGGSEGIAKDIVETALTHGKHVVTANKALLAWHGTELALLAEQNNVALTFEAAVAGGIPIVKTVREGLAGNRLYEVHGILNGTCNYILTEMKNSGRAFAETLQDAQDLGYAESDPSFDVDGIDSAHKLALLTALVFGTKVDFAHVHVEGIRELEPIDFSYAAELGYRIKLLGITRQTDKGVEQRVHPCLVPVSAPIAAAEGVFNAVVVAGDAVERVLLVGRGAGGGPTSSAIVADIIDIARGRIGPAFGIPSAQLKDLEPAAIGCRLGAYYLRLQVQDRPGVLAEIAAILKDEQISIESVLQRSRHPGATVPLVLITHDTEERRMDSALAKIAALAAVEEKPKIIRIERF